MTRFVHCLLSLSVLLTLCAVTGCSQPGTKTQLAGKVTFKGQPVPAGYVSFMPNSSEGNRGEVTVAEIRNGAFDTSQQTGSGILPGPTIIVIAGFDGNPKPGFPQGKQIFNPHQISENLSADISQKDFAVPATAAEDLKIVPTIDP